ncbi:MAG: MFS transporter [Nocardioidaceae bacterium]
MTTRLPAETRLPRTVRLLVLARAVNRLGAFSLPFLAVLLVRRYGVGLGAAGLVMGAFGAATIPSRLCGGRLADRIGRRRTIVLGLGGCAVAQLGIAAAGSLAAATGAVVVLGLVFELYEPPSQAMLADACTPEQRPAAFGLLAAAVAAAGLAAGPLAAWLGHVDLRWLFVADAVTCLAGATVVRFGLPDDRPDPVAAVVARANPWRDPRLLAMLAVGTGFATVYLQVTVGLPLTLVTCGLPAADLGLLLTVSAATVVLGQPLLRRAPAGFTGFRAMAAGYVVLAAGLAATGCATSLPGFVAATALWSVGDLLLMGHTSAVVAALAPAEARGRYQAAFGTCWGLAAVAAPLAGTALLGAGGPLLLWWACAATALLLATVQPAQRRRCSAPVSIRVAASP